MSHKSALGGQLSSLGQVVLGFTGLIACWGCTIAPRTDSYGPTIEVSRSAEAGPTAKRSTFTPSPSPTASTTPSPTATATRQPISAENASRLREIIHLGQAEIVDISHWPDPDSLTIATRSGIQYVDPLTLAETHFVEWQTAGWAFPGVGFSPDGRTLAVTFVLSEEGVTISLVDSISGRVLHRIPTGFSAYDRIVFNGDGSLIAYPDANGSTAHVWEVESGQLIHSLGPLPGQPTATIFHPYEQLLAVADRSGSVSLWNTETGERVRRIRVNEGRMLGSRPNTAWSVTYSHDGELLAVGGWGWITVWKVETGEMVSSLGAPGLIQFVAFNPDNSELAASYAGGTVIYSMATGEILHQLKTALYAWNLSYGSDGEQLVTAGGSAVLVWDAESGRIIHERLDYGSGPATFSLDGTTLAMGTSAGIQSWDTTTWEESTLISDYREAVSSLAYSPDGQLLATYENSGMLRVWDLATQKDILQFPDCVSGFGRKDDVSFSPDSSSIAVGCPNSIAWLINLEDPGRAHKFQLPSSPPPDNDVDVAFSPDGKFLALAGRDGNMAIVEIETLQTVRTIPGEPGYKGEIRFSNDGGSVARYLTTKEALKLLLFRTGSWEKYFEAEGDLRGFAFNSSGKLIAIGGPDRTQLVDTSDGHVVAEIDPGYVVAWSPDDKFLVFRSDALSIWGIEF